MTVAAHFHFEPLGQRVHHRDADAVQAAGHFVAAVVAELAAGVEHGQHRLHRGTTRLGLNADGNAAAVVDDGQRTVLVNDDVHAVGVPGHGFVDAVVHHLD